MDGNTLASAMHARGINMRYLGRVVCLLLERERTVNETENKIVVLDPTPAAPAPTQNGNKLKELPHFMTTIAVMELLARGAKHLFNPYVQVRTTITRVLSSSTRLHGFLLAFNLKYRASIL
jgi:hypothetical protein